MSADTEYSVQTIAEGVLASLSSCTKGLVNTLDLNRNLCKLLKSSKLEVKLPLEFRAANRDETIGYVVFARKDKSQKNRFNTFDFDNCARLRCLL